MPLVSLSISRHIIINTSIHLSSALFTDGFDGEGVQMQRPPTRRTNGAIPSFRRGAVAAHVIQSQRVR